MDRIEDRVEDRRNAAFVGSLGRAQQRTRDRRDWPESSTGMRRCTGGDIEGVFGEAQAERRRLPWRARRSSSAAAESTLTVKPGSLQFAHGIFEMRKRRCPAGIRDRSRRRPPPRMAVARATMASITVKRGRVRRSRRICACHGGKDRDRGRACPK